MPSAEVCEGPLVWFQVRNEKGQVYAAILECAACPYIIVTGNFHDAAHLHTPLIREGFPT